MAVPIPHHPTPRPSETAKRWQRESHCRFWTELFDADFHDWYLGTHVESAKEIGRQPSRPVQLHLPNFPDFRSRDESYLVDLF